MHTQEEQQYWYNRSTQDRIYGDLQHEAMMGALLNETDYKLIQMLQPKITKDGNQWCVLYGENLQDGIAGFGDTPYKAVLNFNEQWHKN